MGNNNKRWQNVSSNTVFIYLSGTPQRVRPGQTVTGSICEATQKDFKLIETPAPVVHTPPASRALKPKEIPKADVKAIKKELKRKIDKAGGKYTHFMNVAKLEAVLEGLTK